MLVGGRVSQRQIGAIPTDTHDYVAPSPDLDFSADGDGNDGDISSPLRGFRGRWLSRAG